MNECWNCLKNKGRVRTPSSSVGTGVFVCNRHLVLAGEGLHQVHQQDLPPADLPPHPPLQVDQAERAQEEVPGLVSVPSEDVWTF